MFENIDERTVKFGLVIIAVIIIFSIPFAVVSSKTPKNMANIENPSVEEINEQPSSNPGEEIAEPEEAASEEEFAEEEQPANHEEIAEHNEHPAEENLEPLENLPEEVSEANGESEQHVEEVTPESLMDKASALRRDRDYVKAIEMYKKAAELSGDSAIQAKCYEEMAMLYGMVKRYGTALAYAQKAYNLFPSTSRELLLARLYYKTGDIDKATRRVNNILQRDFTVDR